MIKINSKFIKQVMAGILLIILWLCPVFSVCARESNVPGGLYATGAVLMDADSGRVLFEKSVDQPMAMASTTKIMTCILALELGELSQVVTFSSNAASMPDVQMNAKAGEQYYLKDLLYSTMLESHNDSAVAVAEAVAGSVEAFTALMNQKAESIGCVNTHFITPNGLDGTDEGGEHRTTAEELALILRYCIRISSKAAQFLEITGAPAYEFQELNGKRYVSCRNHNAFLTAYEGALTGKTGFTGKAGYCYVGAVKRDDRTLIISLLGAGWYPNKSYKWKDARTLFDYGFSNFHYKKIGKDTWEFSEAEVVNGMENKVNLATDAKSFNYLVGEHEKIKCKISYTKSLQAPVEKKMLVGKISYELNEKVIEQYHIFTDAEVKEANFRNKVKKWIRDIGRYIHKLVNKQQKA